MVGLDGCCNTRKSRTVVCLGVPFPRNYIAGVKKIMTRLFRIFVHVYIHHFDKLVGIGAVRSTFVYLYRDGYVTLCVNVC